MSLPDKPSKSQLRFDPNVYTINGKIQELGILHRREEERNNDSFKSYHLHARLPWKKRRNKQLTAFPGATGQRTRWSNKQ